MRTQQDREAMQQEALRRATNETSLANYPQIFAGFMDKGIAEADIKPRENIFTFNAWKALGRFVKKGEHGVKITSWIDSTKTDPVTGKEESSRRPVTAVVFHISQTEQAKGAKPDPKAGWIKVEPQRDTWKQENPTETDLDKMYANLMKGGPRL